MGDWLAITGWCACGGSFSVRSAPPDFARDIRDTFRDLHTSTECRPIDRDEHKRVAARLRRAEKRLLAEGAR